MRPLCLWKDEFHESLIDWEMGTRDLAPPFFTNSLKDFPPARDRLSMKRMLSLYRFGRSRSLLVRCIALVAALFAVRGDAQDPPALELNVVTNVPYYTCGTNGLAVYYAVWASGSCASNAVINCTPPDGSLFTPGVWPVQCTATDTCGNSVSNGFTVTVQTDRTPPVIICPTNQIAYSIKGYAEVFYEWPYASDDTDTEVTCVPGPGSQFPLGTNIVTCTAYDPCGNTNTCSFIVEVRKPQVNGGLLPAGGMQIEWSGDDGLECTDDLSNPWEPVPNPSKPFSFFPTGSAKFIRPAPGIDYGIPTFRGAEIAYVETGLHNQTHTPGVTLRRNIHDWETAGGSTVLAANAGGSTSANVWSSAINIPFKFWFYGQPRTKLCVSKTGLATFDTNVANQPLSFAANVTKLPNPNFPAETIVCYQSAFIPLQPTNHVRAYLYGTAPNRQVWFVWHGHEKTDHGSTHTALVLEETSNRLLMVDMQAEFPLAGAPVEDEENDADPNGILDFTTIPSSARLAVGVQKDTNFFMQVPASPRVQLVNIMPHRQDNDFFVFKPFQVGRHVKGNGSEALSFVDTNVIQRMKRANIPGATVAITYKGRLVYNKSYGYANVETDTEMLPHHRSPIGSVSKIFTATGIFKLIEMGLIESVSNRIMEPNILGKPWFLEAFNQGLSNGNHTNSLAHLNKITLQHLLSHTAGYDGGADAVAAAELYNGGNYTTSPYSNAVKWFMATKPFLTNDVGVLSAYANHGFGQLGQVIENVTQTRYEDFIKAHVLSPIGIHHMRLNKTYLDEQDPVRDARRYHYYSSGAPHAASPFTGIIGPITYGYSKSENGAAGSWAGTARDLARFMCATDKLKNHSDILNTNSLNVMESDPVPEVGSAAHGWMRESSGRLWHNGSIGYGSAYMQKDTNGINIAVCANTANAGVCGDIAQTIYNEMKSAAVLGNINQFYDLFGAQLQLNLNP